MFCKCLHENIYRMNVVEQSGVEYGETADMFIASSIFICIQN